MSSKEPENSVEYNDKLFELKTQLHSINNLEESEQIILDNPNENFINTNLAEHEIAELTMRLGLKYNDRMRMWSTFQPAQLRLFAIKQILNYTFVKLYGQHMLGEYYNNKVEPRTTGGKFVDYVFGDIVEYAKHVAETHRGIKNPKQEFANFLNLIISAHRVLLYICETDRYYEMWSCILFDMIAKRVEEFKRLHGGRDLARIEELNDEIKFEISCPKCGHKFETK